MWDTFNRLAGYLLTLSGLVLLPFTIIRYTDSSILGFYVAGLLFIVLGFGILIYRLPQAFQKRAGIKRYKTPFIVSKKIEKAEIAADYFTTVTTAKEFIFLEPPVSEDLVDVIDLFPGEELDESVYSSDDSNIAKVVNNQENAVAIFWEPKEKLIPNVPYIHHTMYKCPSKYGPDWFWQGNHVDTKTGIISWSFHTPLPVETAVAFKMPWYSSKITERKLFQLATKKKLRNCSQPIVSNERSLVTWELKNPEKGTYICLVSYVGGFENYLTKDKESSAISKIRKYLTGVNNP